MKKNLYYTEKSTPQKKNSLEELIKMCDNDIIKDFILIYTCQTMERWWCPAANT